MKNKKLWLFISLVILILILNHIFKWSSYLGDTDNLTFLKAMIQDNLAGAIAIYMLVTIVGSGTAGRYFCHFGRAFVRSCIGNNIMYDICHSRCRPGISCRKIFFKGQYKACIHEKQISEKMDV